MKPFVKTALASTGTVLVVVAVLLVRLFRMKPLGDGSREAFLAQLVWLGFFGVVLVFGLSIAWWRVFRDQRERRNRPKPLNLG